MNVSSLSSASISYQDQQKQNPFQALGSALQAGDLGAAQTAFSQLQARFQGQSGANTNTNPVSSTQSGSTSPLQTLASALQSGDLAGAQKAFQALQQKAGGHHHHHGHKPEPAQSSNDSTSVNSTSGTALQVNLSA